MNFALPSNSVVDISEFDLPRHFVADAAHAGIIELLATPYVGVRAVRIAPGIATGTDVDIDGFFVVAAGTACVVFEGGDGLLFLRQGVVGRLASGTRTRWTITESLTLICVVDAARIAP